MKAFTNFTDAIDDARLLLRAAPAKTRHKWQGADVSTDPSAAVHEVLYHDFRVSLRWGEKLDHWRRDIRPNLPWADDHFAERVCGYPLNPGREWRNWPWGRNAEKFVDEVGKFDHNYMARYWPRYAAADDPPTVTPADYENHFAAKAPPLRYGASGPYGDLAGVVTELVADPTTRQAILPVFFPDDTGYRPGRRKPCSLHYHFQLNDGELDVEYAIRSCDFTRHFRDDIYLTLRLLLWVLDEAAKLNKLWRRVPPGNFVMHINNLHIFENDWRQL